jgi:Na+-transporting methylmalonyl-CoA/oxaloacetate decarboxylase gamma subunit
MSYIVVVFMGCVIFYVMDSAVINRFVKSEKHAQKAEGTTETSESKSENQALPATVKISIQNGCGKSGLGLKIRRNLVDMGFDVIKLENAPDFNFKKSFLVDLKGDSETAKIASKLMCNITIVQNIEEPKPLEDMILILGQDYNEYFQDLDKALFELE